MQFLCSARKWTSIIRHARLRIYANAEHKLPDHKWSTEGRQLDEQTKQGKSKTSNSLKTICTLTTELNRKMTNSLQIQGYMPTEWKV